MNRRHFFKSAAAGILALLGLKPAASTAAAAKPIREVKRTISGEWIFWREQAEQTGRRSYDGVRRDGVYRFFGKWTAKELDQKGRKLIPPVPDGYRRVRIDYTINPVDQQVSFCTVDVCRGVWIDPLFYAD